jgi:hypothetical protein
MILLGGGVLVVVFCLGWQLGCAAGQKLAEQTVRRCAHCERFTTKTGLHPRTEAAHASDVPPGPPALGGAA